MNNNKLSAGKKRWTPFRRQLYRLVVRKEKLDTHAVPTVLQVGRLLAYNNCYWRYYLSL